MTRNNFWRENSNVSILVILQHCDYCHQQFSEFQSSPIFFTSSALPQFQRFFFIAKRMSFKAEIFLTTLAFLYLVDLVATLLLQQPRGNEAFSFFLLHLSFTRLSPSGFGLETQDSKSDAATKKRCHFVWLFFALLKRSVTKGVQINLAKTEKQLSS